MVKRIGVYVLQSTAYEPFRPDDNDIVHCGDDNGIVSIDALILVATPNYSGRKESMAGTRPIKAIASSLFIPTSTHVDCIGRSRALRGHIPQS